MLPDHVLSTVPVRAPYIAAQVASYYAPLVDYELGGIALNDPSGGLSLQMWSAYVDGDDIVVEDSNGVSTVVLQVPDVQKLSLAFDQNMRPAIAYSTPAGGFLYWFDTFVGHSVTTSIPDATNLCLTLDERRLELINNSDIILAYNKGADLYYRQQRDRFFTEYLLKENDGGTLVAIGTNTQFRLQFKVQSF